MKGSQSIFLNDIFFVFINSTDQMHNIDWEQYRVPLPFKDFSLTSFVIDHFDKYFFFISKFFGFDIKKFLFFSLSDLRSLKISCREYF